MSAPVRKVAVVGGGVAGLALAAALPPSVEVVVHEAQPERAGWGSSLVLGPWVRPALHRLGVLDAMVRAGSPVGPGRLLALDGRPLTRAHDPHLLAVPRPALLATLAAVVPSRVRVVHEEVDDPSGLDADLVVGADGVRSRVRGLVDRDRAERVPTPWVALRGRLDAPPHPGTVGEYWGPGLLVGLVPTPGGGYWFTSHASAAAPEPLDPAPVLAEARALATEAAEVVRRLLADAPGASATRLWLAPALRRYARGRYVVVGDAAHAMTPNLGRGAGEALLDAVTLAEHVAGGGSLVGWQARRLPATQAARAASGLVMRGALAGRGHALRDRAVRLSPVGAEWPPGRR
ncbi:FAD-dependent monooxygenase [Phycicoccus sonneratiae]|uniref:FAD-dependent monooxygenase n=1 Tax=Phycicoccus sonneratiae TaxID=2807628 RepID=A0ABS2CHP2_9MICO|nr:NAD(P)/FAD-dependent oxidoreductase [Phycicoccus sonneraticus]MBM6399383.1 FAD-dependent monooxygenase [Phycicoccus sonneraticus]